MGPSIRVPLLSPPISVCGPGRAGAAGARAAACRERAAGRQGRPAAEGSRRAVLRPGRVNGIEEEFSFSACFCVTVSLLLRLSGFVPLSPPASSSPPQEEPPAERGKEKDPREARASEEEEEKGATYHLPLPA